MNEPVGLKRASGFGRGPVRWRRLGEILTSQRVITRGQLLTALDRQADLTVSGRAYPLGRVLISLGFASSAEIERALAAQARQSAGRRGRQAGGEGSAGEPSEARDQERSKGGTA